MRILAVIFQLVKNVVDVRVFKSMSDEDRDIGMGDSTGVSVSLDGEILSGGRKCQESKIGDSDNTGNGEDISRVTTITCLPPLQMFYYFRDMLLIPRFLIKKLNLSLGDNLVKRSAN
nr:hypothetical protein [Tanacetum cinerariifolium]